LRLNAVGQGESEDSSIEALEARIAELEREREKDSTLIELLRDKLETLENMGRDVQQEQGNDATKLASGS
jgi:prefoldin subunit 5